MEQYNPITPGTVLKSDILIIFETAVCTWLASQGLSRYKVSGVMEHTGPGQFIKYTVSLIPDRTDDSGVEPPETFIQILRGTSPDGFVLTGITTGRFKNNINVPPPKWRIQLEFIKSVPTNISPQTQEGKLSSNVHEVGQSLF